MMKRVLVAVCIILIGLNAGSVYADAKEDKEIANIRLVLSTVVTQSNPDKIEKSVLTGFYVASYGTKTGIKIIYISNDGHYVFNGELIDTIQQINLTERKKSLSRLQVMKSVSDDDMIIFSPSETKHTVTVFTDIDCTYCRKFHRDMDKHLNNGVRIRYMLFPRAGVNSISYRKAVAVWCADDRNQALTDAKAGKGIDMKTCENPVMKHMRIANMLGLTGTPMLILDDGTKIGGYVSPVQLMQYLDKK